MVKGENKENYRIGFTAIEGWTRRADWARRTLRRWRGLYSAGFATRTTCNHAQLTCTWLISAQHIIVTSHAAPVGLCCALEPRGVNAPFSWIRLLWLACRRAAIDDASERGVSGGSPAGTVDVAAASVVFTAAEEEALVLASPSDSEVREIHCPPPSVAAAAAAAGQRAVVLLLRFAAASAAAELLLAGDAGTIVTSTSQIDRDPLWRPMQKGSSSGAPAAPLRPLRARREERAAAAAARVAFCFSALSTAAAAADERAERNGGSASPTSTNLLISSLGVAGTAAPSADDDDAPAPAKERGRLLTRLSSATRAASAFSSAS